MYTPTQQQQQPNSTSLQPSPFPSSSRLPASILNHRPASEIVFLIVIFSPVSVSVLLFSVFFTSLSFAMNARPHLSAPPSFLLFVLPLLCAQSSAHLVASEDFSGKPHCLHHACPVFFFRFRRSLSFAPTSRVLLCTEGRGGLLVPMLGCVFSGRKDRFPAAP